MNALSIEPLQTKSLGTIRSVVAFEYSDGPEEGILQFYDGSAFKFQLLDRLAEDDRDTFILGLHPLPEKNFRAIVELLEKHMKPRWPIWVPIWKFADPAAQGKVESELDGLLADAGALKWVIATDWENGISRTLRPQWIEMLGLQHA